MKQRLVAIFLGFSCALTSAQDYPSPPAQQTGSNPGARYELLQSPLVAKWTFRLDRYAGRVWQLVRTKDNDSAWEEMPVYEGNKIATPNRLRFQLFTSGLAARHTFLIDTDSGKTWALVSGKRTNKDGAEHEVVAWQPFAE